MRMLVTALLAGSFVLVGPAALADLAPGDAGPDVLELQRRLLELHYDPGPLDGRFSQETRTAVWGFQKANGLRPRAVAGSATLRALDRPRPIRPLVRRGARDRVEIDLRRQLMVVYDKGRPALVTHVSTGAGRPYCERGHCGDAITRTGDHRVYQRVRGWQRGVLGAMYKPLYFDGGIAMHGSTHVPLRPASHGCVRIPLHSADLVHRLVKKGEPVHVRGKG